MYRRVGGLEDDEIYASIRCHVYRRVGGLEDMSTYIQNYLRYADEVEIVGSFENTSD